MSETHHQTPASAAIDIDAGVRAWYASCRCCLSDAHPEAVAILDAERDAAGVQDVGATILDPVCDMVVDVEEQRGRGLTSEYSAKTYAFCSSGCKRSFDDDPIRYIAKVATWEASR
ncbi:MAG TPA: YHS domain-containing protein [Candidatus Limnocylindria bacterium]|jgi:Cu+-exporting ATPase|nr:YHS domain-containing protein [Candidatus Limnocylindria bacterium]